MACLQILKEHLHEIVMFVRLYTDTFFFVLIFHLCMRQKCRKGKWVYVLKLIKRIALRWLQEHTVGNLPINLQLFIYIVFFLYNEIHLT